MTTYQNTITAQAQPKNGTKHRLLRENTQDSTLLKNGLPHSDHRIQLIDGVYSAAEADNMLSEMLTNRIKYHNLEAFIILEGYAGDPSPAKQRMEALKSAQESLNVFLKQAREKGQKLEINCTIKIKVV